MREVSGASRALFVHAHPDDESLWTGGTIASLARGGAEVSLVTCTWVRGTTRHGELVDAARELELARDPIMLGYADSFVPDSAPGASSFILAPFDEQVAALVAHIRVLKPQVLVTYDAFGMYGHPDHIHANRLTAAAADAAAVGAYHSDLGDPWQVSSLYFVTIPESIVTAIKPHLATASHLPYTGTPDAQVDLWVDVGACVGCKIRAITSHRTEIARSASMQDFGALPPGPQRLFLRSEAYQRRDLVPGGVDLI
ncbi:PIG-L family deacetylase [Gordonia sp. (in: high G+C Gram-positive bacteria)]|uniref:PIG-L family deacetylase n=1 Tax=Gordonia sp. (in: high G+C Gram-positive bacteria) TaxID=84139 RepID=UPI0016B252FE|nr:PIG-L family deacetylase [Gordonia sp. (in: high G+C Gram-positive bacteria)]NLG46338.1 GlcNAc-PI de-N-acetylase [Gordonia sp. (in: high G+C Gram-positive bacteria)]